MDIFYYPAPRVGFRRSSMWDLNQWPHLASLYASTHNLDEDGKHPDPMMGQDNVFDPSEPYGAYRYYVQPSTRSEFSIEEPGYMSRPVYKDEESRSSDYTSGDSFRRGSNCRVLLCVSLVVSFVGVVVAAITLAVLLSKTPAPLPAKPGHTDEFESQASIFNREFNENLRDNTTDEFKTLEMEFCKAIEQMYTDTDSPVKNAFGGCEVLEFTNGSVQVRYRLKLFSDTFERFKMDEKIAKKLEDHFAKKVNEIGPWQNLKFNPKFIKKFIRIEPPTTPVPPTTKATTTPFKPTIKSTKPDVKTTPKAIIEKTTKQSEPVTMVTRSETPETTTERTTETTTTETTLEMSKDRTTTMQLITTTQVEETKPPIETIQTTRIVKPSIITEKEGLIEITTQEDIRTSEKIIDVHTQKQTPDTIETTSRTTSDEIITTLKPTAEVKDETKAVDNITVTTEMPKASTNIFDMFYDLNDTYETTESGTTEVTELPTIASEVTYTQTILKAVTTIPKEDANQTSTTSPATDSVSKESSTVSEILPVETTIEKEISFTTQTDKTTSIEATTLQSAQTVTDEIIQVTSDKTTDKPKETITGSKADEVVIETTTVVHEDSISSRTTEPANITVKGVDIMSTESPPTVDHNVSTSTTAKMQESTIQIKTEIATEFSNATLPSSVTTSQETEITTSSEIVDETKQPTVTTIPADDVTSTVIPEDTGFVTTQQSSEALKILVNETIGEQGITEPAPILNVSSISDILTTRAIATESEPSSTTSITHIETTKVEVVKDSVTERYNKTVGPDSTLDKKDMQTSPETIHAQLTTVAAPVTNATTIMDTAKLEEVNETSSKGLELTTDATESSDVVEHITK
ncbi:mucin-2-like, partial [Ruditapes philippinarum]|uniref:mucin-2-like n=1 Tax=Ruditapes philippinarum TaxID=129788 RepID=UPI00295AA3B6